MLGGKFRKKLKALLAAAGKALSIIPLTANQFTATSILLALIAALFIANQNLAAGLLFVVLAILVDVLDGSFAEAKK